MSAQERAYTARRLHRVAERYAYAAVRHIGLPDDEWNARSLAEQAYQAARLLLDEGKEVEAALFGAERGLQ